MSDIMPELNYKGTHITMKIIKRLIPLLVVLTLAGCASSISDPNAAFRGQSAQAIYQKAETAMAKGDYDDASKSIEALDALYPFSKYAQKADLDLIYAYYQSGDTASASAAADRYIKLYPRSQHIAYAYYMRGLANFKTDRGLLQNLFHTDTALRDATNQEASFQDFTTLLYRFPDSKYSADARKRLIYLRDQFAKRDVEIAQFYFKRGAYVAAANRAAGVVEHYSHTMQVKPALNIMIKSYDKLGLTQRADDARRVLAKNFS